MYVGTTTAVVQDPTAGERVRYRIGPFWYRYPTAGAWVPKRLAALAQPPGIYFASAIGIPRIFSESPGSHHDFPYRTITVHRYAYQIGPVPVRHNLSTKEVTR